MWVSILLACGVLNGEVTTDCRSFVADAHTESKMQCLKQAYAGVMVIEANNWRVLDFMCYTWENKPEVKKEAPKFKT